LNNLLYSINIVLPIVLIGLLGYCLKQMRRLGREFTDTASWFAFSVGFPLSIFASRAECSVREAFNGRLVAFIVLSIALCTLICLLIVPRFVKNRPAAASMVQAMTRNNCLLQGLSLLTIMYGPDNIVNGVIMLPFAIAMNNVTATVTFVTLIPSQRAHGRNAVLSAVTALLKNPLVISCAAGLAVSALEISLPAPLENAVSSLGKTATPLALLALGANFRLCDFRGGLKYSIPISAVRLILMPAAVTLAAVLLGFRDNALGSIFLFSGSASAAAGSVMARQMGGDGTVADQAVCLTTVLSAFTLVLGIYILKSLNLI
jgi:predicted permease